MNSKKLKVTFMLAPKISDKFAPAGSRIISSNLLRNKKLDVSFSNFALSLYDDYSNNERYKDYFNESEMRNTYLKLRYRYTKYLTQLWNFVKVPDHVYKLGVDEIDSEYIIASAVSFFSFDFIMYLLKAGKKVILGGAVVNTYSDIKNIRKIFKQLNAPNLDNLIIVHGFVDLHTDFYEIIKNWKDVYLPYPDYDSIYDCDYDYLMDCNISPNVVTLPLSEGCYWGKCTFCDIFNGRKNKVDVFYNKNNIKKIQRNINIISKYYPNIDCLHFHENYLSYKTLKFINNELEIPSNIKKLYGYTGIKFLSDENYTKEFAKLSRGYLQIYSLLGIDGFGDFSLKECNRGFDVSDIRKSIINVINNFDKKFDFGLTLIKDLPMQSCLDLVKQNKYLVAIYNLLNEYVNMTFNINYLILYPNSKMTVSILEGSNKYMKLLNSIEDERASGIHYFLKKYLKDYHTMMDPTIKLFTPYYRVGENNQLLPQDDEIESFHGIG